MKSLSRGDVILVSFPFSDLQGSRVRPAVIVSAGNIADDVVLVAISSVVRGARVPTDLIVKDDHPEFAATGLRMTSVIRVHKLATIERSLVQRRMGQLGHRLQEETDKLLLKVLSLSAPS